MRKLGVLIGYFYNKGLILCPNNKLRYFDLNDDIYYFFRNMYYFNYQTDDKKKNVCVIGLIVEGAIAEYEDIPDIKYKVKILNRFKEVSELETIDSSLYDYFQKVKITFNPKEEMHNLLYRANNTDIDKVLASYEVNQYEIEEAKTICYSINTDDLYIHHLLGGLQKYDKSFIDSKYKNAVIIREFDLENQYKDRAKSKYSVIEHINYLMNYVYVPKVESYKKLCDHNFNNCIEVEKKYPVFDVFYLIKKNWPHMKAELLCHKYNEIYDGYNYEIFGKKNSSRKEYLKRRQNSCYRSNTSNYYDSWDPESEVMDILMYGDADILG